MKAILLGLILSIIPSQVLAGTQTNGYYCQVDIPGTISGYYDIYYRMTKTTLGGYRNYAVQVDRVVGNLISFETEVEFEPSQANGKYINLGYINNFSNSSSIGSLNLMVQSQFEVTINLTSFDYEQTLTNAILANKATDARCFQMDSDRYLDKVQ
jgi:hypothetical protein